MGICDGVRRIVYEAVREECRAEVLAMADELSTEELVWRLDACDERAWEEADSAYGRCIRSEAGVSGRGDELMLDCLEAGYSWEMCVGMVFGGPGGAPAPVAQLDIPDRSLAVRRELFDDLEKVKTLSAVIAKGFDQIGLQFKEDETWACLLFVIRRPEYISQLLPAAGEEAYEAALPRMHYILEPGILSQVMDAMQRDKLK